MVIKRQMAEAIAKGMTGECLMAIIDETMEAPRPSWAYCKAIIRRCEGSGIKKLADWEEDRRRHEAGKNPALDYDQRTYNEEDFGEEFFFNYEKFYAE